MIKPYKRHDVLIDFDSIEYDCWTEIVEFNNENPVIYHDTYIRNEYEKLMSQKENN